jgi:hypothetical protein
MRALSKRQPSAARLSAPKINVRNGSLARPLQNAFETLAAFLDEQAFAQWWSNGSAMRHRRGVNGRYRIQALVRALELCGRLGDEVDQAAW